MITYVRTNIFESPAQVIVNTVNTVGVMGRGIAKSYKDIYPDMFKEYQRLCEKKDLEVGKLWLFKTPNKWILNFPTKKHWRYPSKLEYIEAGLEKFVSTYEQKGIRSISFPLLGCGNGGLDWKTQVQPLMEYHLRDLPIDVYIHLSDKKDNPEHMDIEKMKTWLRQMPVTLGFQEVLDDLKESVEHLDRKLLYSGQQFQVEIIEDTDVQKFLFLSDNRQIEISFEQLADLWNFLRDVGFCLWQNLPSDLFENGALVLKFLTILEYVEPVEIGTRYNDDTDLSYGIRLTPYLSKGVWGQNGEENFTNFI